MNGSLFSFVRATWLRELRWWRPRLIRASNTRRVLGLRIGPLNVLSASEGFVDCYRNGYVVRLRGHKLGFIPTTRYHRANV